MKFLLIPDKFKGSLSAEEVIRALEQGIGDALEGAVCIPVLASDGGDGFLNAVAKYRNCIRIRHECSDPLGRKLTAEYLLNGKGGEAYLELAAASGLVLLKQGERSALNTSTYGTGLQLKDAIARGATDIYIGLGGSATNDAGIGIAAALGYRFLDSEGRELTPVGASLGQIETIDTEQVSVDLTGISVTAINDVNNPLFGPDGAAYVYAAQKGAGPEDIHQLDQGLQHLDLKVRNAFGKDVSGLPGTGAAGGAAYGLKVFFEAQFLSGIDFILHMAGIHELMEKNKVDFIITGEGKIDRQTLSGKLIHGVLQLGKSHGVPVLAVCGKLDVPREILRGEGLHDVIEVSDPDKPLKYNMDHASRLLETAIRDYFR